ncbi:MAG: restriction endonuclease, partial [Paraprevotella sp.]|nr:restriction endonuclease [Paraprevotella sp.]
DSYLVIGGSRNKDDVFATYKYLRCKFSRFMLMLSVSSINLSKEKFQFVPLQDFTANSDIDWNQSIAEIDAQLYRKYNLNNDEIDFIERMIKPME